MTGIQNAEPAAKRIFLGRNPDKEHHPSITLKRKIIHCACLKFHHSPSQVLRNKDWTCAGAQKHSRKVSEEDAWLIFPAESILSLFGQSRRLLRLKIFKARLSSRNRIALNKMHSVSKLEMASPDYFCCQRFLENRPSITY